VNLRGYSFNQISVSSVPSVAFTHFNTLCAPLSAAKSRCTSGWLYLF
jgi:hypothetical protein